MGFLKACVLFLRAMLVPQARLAIENLALRQQVAVFKQSITRPKLWPRDRVFWGWLTVPSVSIGAVYVKNAFARRQTCHQGFPEYELRFELLMNAENTVQFSKTSNGPSLER